jgi:hypothetical protein
VAGRPPGVRGPSAWLGHTEDGRPATFAGEPRALHAISEALRLEDEPVRAIAPIWALL